MRRERAPPDACDPRHSRHDLVVPVLPSPPRRPREDDEEPTELGEEQVGLEGGAAEEPIEEGDPESWLDTEHGSNVEAPSLDVEDGPSALDDTPADIDDEPLDGDPLGAGDETRWTEGSEADGSVEHAAIDADGTEDGLTDDGAEGLEDDTLEPGFGEGDVTPGSDEAVEELSMGTVAALEQDRATSTAGDLVGIGSHDGEGVEVRAHAITIGAQRIVLPHGVAGGIVLDDDTVLCWTAEGIASIVREGDAPRTVADDVVLAAPRSSPPRRAPSARSRCAARASRGGSSSRSRGPGGSRCSAPPRSC
jgi:hypothetical protein